MGPDGAFLVPEDTGAAGGMVPLEIELLLLDKSLGAAGIVKFAPGVLVPEANPQAVLDTPLSRFKNLNTFSLTGLPRPADDKCVNQMQWSDPIFSVWGEAS